MNNFTVYTMDGCPYCEKVQELLREAGQKFVTYKIDKDFTPDSFCLLYTSPSPRD